MLLNSRKAFTDMILLADCKSVGLRLRRFKSFSHHQQTQGQQPQGLLAFFVGFIGLFDGAHMDYI